MTQLHTKKPELEILGKVGRPQLSDTERRQRSMELVEQALQELEGNASALARVARVAPNTANQWRRGAIPDPKYIARFCHLAGYTLEEALDFIEGNPQKPAKVGRLIKEIRSLSRGEFMRLHTEVTKYANDLIAGVNDA